MQNFSTATEATETALNSTGSAASENEKYMESLNAKVSKLKQTFQELSSAVIGSNLVSGILDLANAFLQLGNTPIGEFVIQVGLLTGLLWGGTGLINAMKIIPSFFSKASSVLTGASGLSKLLSLSGPQILALTAGLTAVTTIGPKVIDFLKDWSGDVDYAKERVDELTASIETTKSAIEQMESIDPEDMTFAEKNRLESYRTTLGEQEAEVEEQRAKILEDEVETLREMIQEEKTLDGMWQIRNVNSLVSDQYFDSMVDKYYDSKDAALAALEANEELQSQYYDNEALIVRATGTMEDYINISIDKYEEYINQLKYKGEVEQENLQDFQDLSQSLIDIYEELSQYSEEALDEAGLLGTYETLGMLLDMAHQLTGGVEGLESGTRSAINSFGDNVTQAFYQVDQSGAVTQETLQQLVGAFPQLADESNAAGVALIDVEGNLTAAGIAAFNSSKDLYTFIDSLIQAEIDAKNFNLSNLVSQFDWVTRAAGAAGAAAAAVASVDAQQAAIGISVPRWQSESVADSIASYANQQANQLKQQINSLKNMQTSLSNAYSNYSTPKPSSSGGGISSSGGGGRSSSSGGSSSSARETDPIEEQNDLFREQNEIIEHNIFLREKQGASEEELIKLNKNYQSVLNQQANWFRSQGLSDDSEYIRSLQQQWWSLQDEIEDLQEQITQRQRDAFDERLQLSEDYIDKRNLLNAWGADNEVAAWKRVLNWMDDWYEQGLIDYEYYLEQREDAFENYLQAEQEAWENAKEKELESLQDQQNVYETLFSMVADRAQEEIDALQAQRDAIEAENEALNEQIELEEALDALARARQTKVLVYKDGKFQYVNDADAVSEATANLEQIEAERELQERLDAIDKEIEYWEKYKEEWSSVVSDYEKNQDALLLEQELGIKLEGENWEQRLENLQNYVDRYNDIMGSIQTVQDEIDAGWDYGTTIKDQGMGQVDDGGGTKTDWSQVWWDAENDPTLSEAEKNAIQDYAHSQKEQEMAGTGATYNPSTGTWTGGNVSSSGSSSSSSSTSSNDNNGAISLGGLTSSMMDSVSSTIDKIVSGKYALGTESAIGGLSLVGENGPELRILNSGDGILPSNVTKNLWGWSKLNPNDFVRGMRGAVSITIDKFAPVLSNVTNGEEFANYLKNNFWRKVVQHVY